MSQQGFNLPTGKSILKSLQKSGKIIDVRHWRQIVSSFLEIHSYSSSPLHLNQRVLQTFAVTAVPVHGSSFMDVSPKCPCQAVCTQKKEKIMFIFVISLLSLLSTAGVSFLVFR